LFNYDPGTAREDFVRDGYVHLKDILSQPILDYLVDFYQSAILDHATEQDQWQIYGKKRQYLFDFPSDETAEQFRDGMSRLTGIAPEKFTISERHLKVYDQHADAWPAPHKDRAASEISIGLPVHLPSGTSACVFPDLQFGHNQEEKAVFLTDRDRPDLKDIYQNEKCVMLNERFGDVIAFLGSSVFHERVNAAGTAILYIKVNGTGSDPLGENLYSAERV